MNQAQHKNAPINIRALTAQRALIDKAATLSNKTRSQFILESACKEAENILLDQRLFFIDDKAYKTFILKLESPVKENLALKKLLKSKSVWEK